MNIGLKPVTEQLSDEYNVIKKKKKDMVVLKLGVP